MKALISFKSSTSSSSALMSLLYRVAMSNASLMDKL